jgi:hypothetical protein
MKHYKVSFAPHSEIEYTFGIDAKDADEARELARNEFKFDIGYDRYKDFECVKIETTDVDDEEPDNVMKYYVAEIEQHILEYEPITTICFKTDEDGEEYFADLVKGFMGDDDPEEPENDGVYWYRGESTYKAGLIVEVSEEDFEVLKAHISDITGMGYKRDQLTKGEAS